MAEDQRNEEFETPPIEEIPAITRRHVAHLEATTDEAAWTRAGMRHLLLRTVGRKSGREHTVALPYWCDAQGRRIIAASYAGGPKHPAWFHNLSDDTANPKVWIRDRTEAGWVEVEILDGDEYRATWNALIVDRPFFADYQAKCERRIPLIRLPARPEAV